MNTLHVLLQTKLGPKRDLDQWVLAHRADHLAWDDIAALLTETTGVDVGREWLRRRYRNQNGTK